MSNENHMQLPNGRWIPAQSLGWQPGIDWEVGHAPSGGWEATAYDEDVPVAVIRSRSKFLLNVRIALRHWVLSR